jgi:glycosyltransferase involved in cell wall biosynthesis
VSRRLRVCHVISTLAAGGAQTMLLRLLARAASTGIAPSLVCLAPPGLHSADCAAAGVPPLHLPRDPLAVLHAITRAEVVQTWLPHADLAGGLAAAAAHRPLAWNLRNSNPGSFRVKRHTRLAIAACARLSRSLPDAIVCCAESARAAYAAAGYATGRMTVIGNGFDLAQLHPDPAAPAWLRASLGLPADVPLVAMVARWDPQKDHACLVAAAAIAVRARPELRVLAIGQGVDEANPLLVGLRREAGLGERLLLLGHRSDAHRVMAGCDATLLSSRLEGFPNVVAESMAHGVPCVATRAGDAAGIVGDCAPLADPGDAAALAAGLLLVLADGAEARAARAQRCRSRIAERFSLDAVAAAYAAMWWRLAERP